jgi:anaerobic selenocysteine-containing dehydrogenase
MSTTHFRTCPLCEATCGLELTMEGDTLLRVRGDDDDVFSKGFICPKGTAVKQLHEDPDRLRAPMIREGETFREATWEEAFAAVERGLAPIIAAGDRDAVALYLGNPTVHSLSASVMTPILVRAFGSKNFYSATTVDQMPKHVTSGLMFGSATTIPVPDIDRTDYLLIVGANPWASNGSLATAPDWPGRLKAISARGGKVVVIDPRRTRTAEEADEHIQVRPGTDALLLFAIARTIFAEGLATLGDVALHVEGLESARAAVEPFTPQRVAELTCVNAATIERIAREFAAATSAGVYDRVGAHQNEFGTLTSWASELITIITGNLDRAGGKMFPYAAHLRPDPGKPGGRGFAVGRFRSRVKGYAEAFGQLPIATLADEIETPGDGRVRAFITVGGNPVLSAPNGARLAAALGTLDFMVAVDPYINETTRFADVILPPTSLLARHHYDLAFYSLSVRNVANYSAPLVEADGPDEWEIFARLTLVASGQPVGTDPLVVTGIALTTLVQRAVSPGGSLAGRNAEDIVRALEGRGPIEQILDLRLRSGPYGDLFGAPGRADAGRVGAEPARRRPRPSVAAHPEPAPDGVRQGGARAGTRDRRRAPAATQAGRDAEGRHGVDRAQAAPLQQFLDAQRRDAEPREQHVHAAPASRRCRAPGDQGRRCRAHHLARRHR